jgi:sulfur-carrier protein
LTLRAGSRQIALMAHVTFTRNIQRHVPCPPTDAPGRTVREVLEQVFRENPRARGYVLDDQGALRKHMLVFINGTQIEDRVHLSDPVPDGAELSVIQALSGG